MNEGNKQMSVLDPRAQHFDGILPPAEWICIIDGTMHRYDPDETMRFRKETYKILLDLTKKKNLCVVFVGSDLDGDHARKQFEELGQMNFPWIQCINEHTNATAFLAHAKCVIANQSPLAQMPAKLNVPTIQLEVDSEIPWHSLGEKHRFLPHDSHNKVIEYIDEIL